VEGILTLSQSHITIDSSISKIEAVFIPKTKLTSPYLQRNAKSDDHLIISNGGVIQWISPQPNPVYEIDPWTGMLVLDKYGGPKFLRTILEYFTGTQNYSFPPSFLLTFYPNHY
jgi:hypothetical protein